MGETCREARLALGSHPVSNAPTTPSPTKPRFSRATLGRILSLARPQSRRLWLGTFFLLLASGLGLVYPKIIGDIIDQALHAGDRSRIDNVALAMVFVFLAQGVAMALRYYLFTTAGERVVTQLRQNLFKSLM